jgi:hypothetical protein
MRKWLDSGRTRTYLSIGGAKANSQNPIRRGNIPTAHGIFDGLKVIVLSIKED